MPSHYTQKQLDKATREAATAARDGLLAGRESKSGRIKRLASIHPVHYHHVRQTQPERVKDQDYWKYEGKKQKEELGIDFITPQSPDGHILSKPLSPRGRANFEAIFGERKPSFNLADIQADAT